MGNCLDKIASGCGFGNQLQPTNNEPKPNVTNIADVNGKVIVTLDNGTFLEAPLSVVEKDFGKGIEASSDNSELVKRLEKLEAFNAKLLGSLVDVGNLADKNSFKALNTEFTGE